MNNKHLSWYKEINNNIIIASRAYFLHEIPGRVQEWKKSSTQCGADVALSLVRFHCKEASEDKLAAIKVANTKKHDFQSFMETFIAAATRIADGIDLDLFVEPASPPPPEWTILWNLDTL